MKTLKTLALIGASALAVSAVSTAAAQAQPYGGNGYGHRYEAPRYDARLTAAYVDRLDDRVLRSIRTGVVTWSQAHDLRRELSAVRPLAIRAESGRANPRQIQRLKFTLNRVEAATQRYASNDRRWRH